MVQEISSANRRRNEYTDRMWAEAGHARGWLGVVAGTGVAATGVAAIGAAGGVLHILFAVMVLACCASCMAAAWHGFQWWDAWHLRGKPYARTHAKLREGVAGSDVDVLDSVVRDDRL